MTDIPIVRSNEDLQLDIEKAQTAVLEILHRFKVDLAAQAFIDNDGTIKARPVWVALKEDGKETDSKAA